uniref:Uncharacterized protein n=1 Tax=Romanomermis culicivorax TaxID=13658 RepID=A0A915LA65_ROMCU
MKAVEVKERLIKDVPPHWYFKNRLVKVKSNFLNADTLLFNVVWSSAPQEKERECLKAEKRSSTRGFYCEFFCLRNW